MTFAQVFTGIPDTEEAAHEVSSVQAAAKAACLLHGHLDEKTVLAALLTAVRRGTVTDSPVAMAILRFADEYQRISRPGEPVRPDSRALDPAIDRLRDALVLAGSDDG